MNIIINSECGMPIYAQIEKQIKENILKNILDKNDALPSIRKLSKELKISVITTKKAYGNLEKEGFIYTIQGKGTFISSKDKKFIQDAILKNVNNHLSKGIDEGLKINLSLENMKEKLEIIYKE